MANLEAFVRRRSPGWVELDTLVLRSGGLGDRPQAGQVRRMYLLYRSAAADLAYARREFPGERDVLRLDDLVRRASQQVYGTLPRKRFDILGWFGTGMWQRIAERPVMVIVCILALMVPFVASAAWANADPAAAESVAPAGYSGVVDRNTANLAESPEEKIGTSLYIFTNNITVAALVFAAGVAVGIGSVAMLMTQGLLLGSVIGLTIENGNGSYLFQFMFAHGFLELSLIAVAGAAGLRLGWSFIDPGYEPRLRAVGTQALAAVQMLLVVVLGLVFCGCVEGILSTSAPPPAVGVTIGIAIAALFWGMVIWRGRSSAVIDVA